MERFQVFKSTIITIVLIVGLGLPLNAQNKKVRPSLKASISQTIGVDTEVNIVYSRPGVKGRTIWGDLVPYGMSEGNKYSKGKPFPWRAGANENSTFETTKDILIEGKLLPAGKYSIHMIPGKTEFVVIFNMVNDQWGSYTYNETKDALRINVTPVKVPIQEWLTFGFDNLDGTSAICFLNWDNLRIPFKISTK